MDNAAEILRLLHNLIRIGTIEEIDHEIARVRVKSGDNITDWIPWRTPRAGETTTWDPPTLGEQVILLSPAGDLAQAVILTGIYSDQHPAPSQDENVWLRRFPDGTEVAYNHQAKKLSIDAKGDLELKLQGNLKATVSGTADVIAQQIKLNEGMGVVTGAHICAYTGAPHIHCSQTVKAGP